MKMTQVFLEREIAEGKLAAAQTKNEEHRQFHTKRVAEAELCLEELKKFISFNNSVSGSLPSARQVALNYIQEIFIADKQPVGNRGEITEDVLADWFTEIGKRNGNDR